MVGIASNLNLNMNIKIHSNVHYCIFLDVQEMYMPIVKQTLK